VRPCDVRENYSARPDASRNRLYIKLAGQLDVPTATAAANLCVQAAKALRPGFDIVNDVSEMKPSSDAASAIISRAQGEIAKLGPRHVVRVVGAAKVAAMQMSRTAREANVGHTAYTVATAAEAEALLEKK
jgi:hypothetical protein